MTIPCKGLSADERADLARLLFKAGHAVRPVKSRETKTGPYTHAIELLDIKNTAPDGANIDGGRTK